MNAAISARPAVGIDLGTSNSCVSVYQNGEMKIIADNKGNRTMPSYVAFTGTEHLIGHAAKDLSEPGYLPIYAAKRLIGDCRSESSTLQADTKHLPFIASGNKEDEFMIPVEHQEETIMVSPVKIISMVLLKLKETAEVSLGKPVTTAVVSVPAVFNDSQRRATLEAARTAGLDVLQIVNEPTAAAIAYGFHNKVDGKRNVLIYDLGGGTLDVSIVTIENGTYTVKATAGNAHLGGEDFSNRMVDYFMKEFNGLHEKNMSTDKRAVHRLRMACERAKHILSCRREAFIDIASLFDGIDFQSRITRICFSKLNEDLFLSAMKPVRKVIKDAKMDKTQIDDIVLIGGSTHIPKVRKLLQDFFDGKELNKSMNRDEAVAKGAAVLAASLLGDIKSEAIQKLVVKDVTAFTLSFCYEKDCSHVLVTRNTTIPTAKTNLIQTRVDNQLKSWITVYEGESIIAKENNILGIFNLRIDPPVPTGLQFEITFDIDKNGILDVKATRESDDEKERVVARNTLKLHCSSINNVVKLFPQVNRMPVIDKIKETMQWLVLNPTADRKEFEDMLLNLKHAVTDYMMTMFEQYGLEAESVDMYNCPDEHFSERYFSFRSRVVGKMEPFIRGLVLPDLPIMADCISIKLNQVFNGFEGSIHVPIDGQRFKLDPVPFDEMVNLIKDNCPYEFVDTVSEEFKLTELEELKKVAIEAVKRIGEYGVSPALGMMHLYEGIIGIVNSIKVSSTEVMLSKEVEKKSVEVKKTGTLFIASYTYSLTGRTDSRLFFSKKMVKLDILTKVWKFPTIGDLKKKYFELSKTSQN